MIERQETANPAPLGLLGFGMTTILLNIHNARFFPLDSMIMAMGFFYGGVAQIIAGIMEFKKGNTFGLTAFVSYGHFWLSLVALVLLPRFGWIEAPSAAFMGWYLALWGLFTLFMWVGTFGKNRAIQSIFFTLTVLFFMLALRDWTGSTLIGTTAGYVGIFCGALAMYLAAAEVINESRGWEVLPIGVVTLARSSHPYAVTPETKTAR